MPSKRAKYSKNGKRRSAGKQSKSKTHSNHSNTNNNSRSNIDKKHGPLQRPEQLISKRNSRHSHVNTSSIPSKDKMHGYSNRLNMFCTKNNAKCTKKKTSNRKMSNQWSKIVPNPDYTTEHKTQDYDGLKRKNTICNHHRHHPLHTHSSCNSSIDQKMHHLEIIEKLNNLTLSNIQQAHKMCDLLSNLIKGGNIDALFIFEIVHQWIDNNTSLIIANDSYFLTNTNHSNPDDYKVYSSMMEHHSTFISIAADEKYNSNSNASNHNNTLLMWAENDNEICHKFIHIIFEVVHKQSFNALNKLAWSLMIIKILSLGLPNLCSLLMIKMAENVQKYKPVDHYETCDGLRNTIMFLRPEIIEQCAELVLFNAYVYEYPFKQLINALCDNYQPFHGWLFARLCSPKRDLVNKTLATYISMGDNHINRCDDEHFLDRLLDAFKFCIFSSNQLLIKNQASNYYHLG